MTDNEQHPETILRHIGDVYAADILKNYQAEYGVWFTALDTSALDRVKVLLDSVDTTTAEGHDYVIAYEALNDAVKALFGGEMVYGQHGLPKPTEGLYDPANSKWVVADTANIRYAQRARVLGYFPTEDIGAEFIAKLPGFSTGRYILEPIWESDDQ